MILGIGNDIVEVGRIQEAMEKHGSHFLDRLFTAKEQAYCSKHKEPAIQFAGRFCAKEAIVKALGVGFGKDVSWQDLEIVNNEHGKPLVELSPHVASRFNRPKIHLSLSHTKQYATAVAIWSNE